MNKFVLKKLTSVKGKQEFYELVILPENANLETIKLENCKGVYQLFTESLEGKFVARKYGLEAVMNRVANIRSVTETQWRDVTPTKESVKEWEVKYQGLRLFAISVFGGKVIFCGGLKNAQKSDFNEFRGLKKRYLDYIKNKNK